MSQQLLTLIDLMIPADPVRGLPSGSEIEELRTRINSGQLPQLLEAANTIASVVSIENSHSLEQMSPSEFETFVKLHRAAIESQLRVVGDELMRSYYTDSRVQDAIGGSSRPPFPSGYPMPENNLDLLEEVFNRGPIYREVPNEQ